MNPDPSPAAQTAQTAFHADVVDEVGRALVKHPVVVIGMGWNPHVGRVRKQLEAGGVDYEYLGYGNYLTGWKKRLAIKLWSGWPTFPQVFVRGTLIGGEDLTRQALADGSVRALLAD